MGALTNCDHSRWDYTIGRHVDVKVYKQSTPMRLPEL
jgi:hypothetical protein